MMLTMREVKRMGTKKEIFGNNMKRNTIILSRMFKGISGKMVIIMLMRMFRKM